jgi:hypothetical protein
LRLDAEEWVPYQIRCRTNPEAGRVGRQELHWAGIPSRGRCEDMLSTVPFLWECFQNILWWL